MDKDEVRAVFKHGQALLDAVYGHLSDRALEGFDRTLSDLYDSLGLEHNLCPVCDADVPNILLSEGACPKCGG
jgi:hypothetical protein